MNRHTSISHAPKGSNLNGNPTLTYSLSAAGVTVHNGESIGSDKNIRVSIWRSGDYPAGPYIRFSDLQTYTKQSGYNQPLTLLLNTKTSMVRQSLLRSGFR